MDEHTDTDSHCRKPYRDDSIRPMYETNSLLFQVEASSLDSILLSRRKGQDMLLFLQCHVWSSATSWCAAVMCGGEGMSV